MSKYDHIDFKPPQGVQDEAQKGLDWRKEYGRGGTEVGVARARDLSNGRSISPETAKRMHSYFARHQVDKQGEGWAPGEDGFPSAGRIAWALWGGDPGEAWAGKLVRQIEAADKPQARESMKTLRIDGVIGTGPGEFSARQMAEFLEAAAGGPIEVTIHSEGGSVYEGMAIHDLVASYKGPTKAVIRSMAFSIASFIPLAFDEVEISPNGWLMLHNPYTLAEGDDRELSIRAEQVKGIKRQMIDGYAERMGKDAAIVSAIMEKETFIDAAEAVEMGLVDRITGEAVKSERGIRGMAKLPHSVVSALLGSSPTTPEERPMAVEPKQPASARAIKQALPKAKSDFIVRCMEKEMSLDEVKDEYLEEMAEEMVSMDEEKKSLMEAKAAMEQELEALKAKLEAMEKEQPTNLLAAKYKAGVQARAAASATDAVASGSSWDEIVAAYQSKGMSKMQAVRAAAKSHPEVRAALVASANVK